MQEERQSGPWPYVCAYSCWIPYKTVHGEEDTDMKAAPGESADQEGGAKAPKHKKCFVGDSQKKYRENQETIYPVQNGLGQSSSFAVTSIFYR